MSAHEAATELAPTGTLRAALNFGNPVLVQRDQATGEPRGASVALARELARRLSVPVEFLAFDGAVQVFEAARDGQWDIAFMAIDPLRAADIEFTAPYVLIEGIHVVRDASPLRTVADVDAAGVRVVVVRGSAYDLFLTRTLSRAELVRVPPSENADAAFLASDYEVLAGVRQPQEALVRAQPGLRALPGRFMAIEQAMGTPKGRPAGSRYVAAFIEEQKASGFVRAALDASGQRDAVVAP